MADENVINGVADDRTIDIEDSNDTDSKSTLLTQIAALEQEKLQLVHENEMIKERVKKLQQEIQSLECNNTEMKREMDRSQDDKKALESIASRASQLESEVSRLQHDLITSMNEGQEANAELSDLKSQLSELKKRESDKGSRLDAIQKENDLLLEKVATLEAKEGNHKKELISFEEDYKKRVNEKENEIVTLKTLVGKLENMLKEERVELERGKNEKEELGIVTNELEALLKKSERKVKELENKVAQLEKELDVSEKVIYGLKNDESLNGKGVMLDRDVVGQRDKGLSSLQWPVVAGSAGTVTAVALVAVIFLRYSRQK